MSGPMTPRSRDVYWDEIEDRPQKVEMTIDRDLEAEG